LVRLLLADRATLVAENLALRQQLAVALRRHPRRAIPWSGAPPQGVIGALAYDAQSATLFLTTSTGLLYVDLVPVTARDPREGDQVRTDLDPTLSTPPGARTADTGLPAP
jgi:hypothetical protein